MELIDIIVILVLALIVAGIIFYIRKEKKRGNKCIGCPYGGKCSGGCEDKK